MKTHKGSKKRMKRTGTGRLMRRANGKRHLLSSKSSKRIRRLKGWHAVSDGDRRNLERQFGGL